MENLNLNSAIYSDMGHQAPVSTSTCQTAASTLYSEVAGNGYIMAHHIETLWPRICEKMQEIAQGNKTFQEVVEIISYFVNNEDFQSRYRRSQPKPIEFMLDEFFSRLTQQKKDFYEKELLPAIAKLILETETLFPLDQKFSILKQCKYENQKITLSKRQCACLIAHMAFCIIIDQAHGHKLPELIDFSVLYSKPGKASSLIKKLHKIRCIFTYFETVLSENQKPEGIVVFERTFLLPDGETWENCDKTITKAQIITQGGIENAKDALQVLFSDKEIGDEVLQLSATQQQIAHLIHPELMPSLLFCEKLKKDESLRVYGAERYSNHTGFGKTFAFVGPYTENQDLTERQHVIMNAKKYDSKQAKSQFGEKCVLRELNKAYSGFALSDKKERAVATGRWGCGVFKGNPQLKFIIQWLAASRAHRDIVFYDFESDGNFIDEETQKIFDLYTGKDVGELFTDLIKAAMEMQTGKMNAPSMKEDVMLAESEGKKVVLAESKKDDDKKNLFKVLITLKSCKSSENK